MLPPSFILKKSAGLHHKGLAKHPFFTKFLLFLIESEVGYIAKITNFLKNQLKNIFTEKTLYPKN